MLRVLRWVVVVLLLLIARRTLDQTREINRKTPDLAPEG